MQIQNKALLSDLRAQVQALLHFAQTLQTLETVRLQQHPNPQSWNALECLEHLNRYGDFYLPAVQKALETAPPASEENYSIGWLGGYFVKSMALKEGGKGMKTFRDKDPFGTPLDQRVILRFGEQHRQWLQLLEAAGRVSLQRTKVPLSIAPWLKLRLGDVLRFVLAHEQRHKRQMERILEAL